LDSLTANGEIENHDLDYIEKLCRASVNMHTNEQDENEMHIRLLNAVPTYDRGEIRIKQLEDAYISNIINKIKDGGEDVSELTLDQDGVLYKKARDITHADTICLPQSLVETTLNLYHKSIFGGHFGVAKTLKLMQDRFYWVAMKRDIINYVQQCESCQQVKKVTTQKLAPMVKFYSSYGVSCNRHYRSTSFNYYRLQIYTNLYRLVLSVSICLSHENAEV
jgi:hypothetical protein